MLPSFATARSRSRRRRRSHDGGSQRDERHHGGDERAAAGRSCRSDRARDPGRQDARDAWSAGHSRRNERLREGADDAASDKKARTVASEEFVDILRSLVPPEVPEGDVKRSCELLAAAGVNAQWQLRHMSQDVIKLVCTAGCDFDIPALTFVSEVVAACQNQGEVQNQGRQPSSFAEASVKAMRAIENRASADAAKARRDGYPESSVDDESGSKV